MTTRQRRRATVRATRARCYDIVVARAKGFCERCGIPISTRRPRWHPQCAQMNHRLALSLGGTDTPENCELICRACHLPGGQHAPTAERMAALQTDRDDLETL